MRCEMCNSNLIAPNVENNQETNKNNQTTLYHYVCSDCYDKITSKVNPLLHYYLVFKKKDIDSSKIEEDHNNSNNDDSNNDDMECDNNNCLLIKPTKFNKVGSFYFCEDCCYAMSRYVAKNGL